MNRRQDIEAYCSPLVAGEVLFSPIGLGTLLGNKWKRGTGRFPNSLGQREHPMTPVCLPLDARGYLCLGQNERRLSTPLPQGCFMFTVGLVSAWDLGFPTMSRGRR